MVLPQHMLLLEGARLTPGLQAAVAAFDARQAQLVERERAKRAERARTGCWTITPLADSQFEVINGENGHCYRVGWDSGRGWQCNCDDRRILDRRGLAMVPCKHVMAVCLHEPALVAAAVTDGAALLTGQMCLARCVPLPPESPSRPHTTIKETNSMSEPTTINTPPQSHPAEATSLPVSVIALLEEPMDVERVRTRKAPGGEVVPYISGDDAIDNANRVFGYNWMSKVIAIRFARTEERAVMQWDAEKQRRVPTGEVKPTGIYYAIVSVRAYGVRKSDVGRCICDGNSPEAHDMAIAGAVTDGLKRALRQFGRQWGNELYDKTSDVFQAALQQSRKLAHVKSGNGSAQSKPTPQASASKGNGHGRSGSGVPPNGNGHIAAPSAEEPPAGGVHSGSPKAEQIQSARASRLSKGTFAGKTLGEMFDLSRNGESSLHGQYLRWLAGEGEWAGSPPLTATTEAQQELQAAAKLLVHLQRQ